MATSAPRRRGGRLPLLAMLLLFLAFSCTTTTAHLRGQLSSAELAQRQRDYQQAQLCAQVLRDDHGSCGGGEGVFVCEYDGYYATRCVKRDSFRKHLDLHPKNYCGACRKCFLNHDELLAAVQKYTLNSTQNTSIAKVYGWPIGRWCVDSVTDFSHLFSGQVDFNEDLGDWDVGRATSMESMFLEAFRFNQDLGHWNTAKVTDMSLMFDRSYAFAGHGLAHWDTSKVTSFQRMFRLNKRFREDLSGWNTALATDMSLMFYRAEAFNQPVGDWDVSRVTDLGYQFAFAKSFNQSLAQWDTSRATTLRGMFQNAESFAQDLTTWDVSRSTDMSFMFSNAPAFQEVVDEEALLKAWNIERVEHKQEMFGVISPAFNQTVASVLTSL